jgi:hypothetical protein
MTTVAAVNWYLRRGWQVVPVPPNVKRPVREGWNNTVFTPADFADNDNVGLLLGQRSGGLTDIDLDCAEALALADLYLPTTEAIFGRPARPRSHRLYIVPNAKFETFVDPLIDKKNTLVELRTDGATGGAHHTLAPPSIADGDRRTWAGERIAPAVVTAAGLRLQVARLAVAALVMRYVSETASREPSPDLPDLLWEFDRPLGAIAYQWLGLPDPLQPRRYPRSRHEMSRRDLDLASIVNAIPNVRYGWEEWNKIGLAIYAASGGSGDGLVIFDDFSAKSPNYDPHAVEERWRNYRRSPPSNIGIGYLARLARNAGYRPERRAS